MYKLYNVKTWGSMSAHFVLEELGVPYQNIWLTPEQVRAPEFREISPLGLIPALGLSDGHVVFESAAIVAFLTDAHPDKGLAPGPGQTDHGLYLSWLIFMAVNIYQMLSLAIDPASLTGSPDQDEAVPRRAAERSNELFDVVEARLRSDGPFILGSRFSAADLYLFNLSVWARSSEADLLARCPAIAKVSAAVRARPKLKAALEAHGVLQPGGYGA